MSQTHPTAPVTKTARQARIAAILAREQVRSQEELADLLERHASVHVTQATLSRDLDELGVVRLRAPGGALVYALPEEPGGPGSRPGAPGSPGSPGSPGASTSPILQTPQTLPTSPTSPTLQAPRAAPGAPPTAATPEPRASSGHRASQRQREHTAESARDGRLARYLTELMTSAEASANLVVLRTPAGAAQFLASVVDHAALPMILGTVAGDDTVLVITRDPAGGDALAADLLRRADRRRLEASRRLAPMIAKTFSPPGERCVTPVLSPVPLARPVTPLPSRWRIRAQRSFWCTIVHQIRHQARKLHENTCLTGMRVILWDGRGR
jgi:transcriptional regulator of arginine metabolism